jgi:hypothetical protein
MRIIRLALLTPAALTVAHADFVANITLETSPLIGHPAGPFSIGFEFADGSGIGDGNNAVFLSNFDFGAGGSVSGSPLTFGSVGGDLSSAVVMTDATSISSFLQPFVAGNTLSFLLDITTNVDSGGMPDEFIMSILDNTFTPVPTTASSALSPFLVVDIDSAKPTVQTFGSDPTQIPADGGPISMNAPTISTVPEPASAVLGTLPILYLVWARRRRAKDIHFVQASTAIGDSSFRRLRIPHPRRCETPTNRRRTAIPKRSVAILNFRPPVCPENAATRLKRGQGREPGLHVIRDTN